MPTIRTVTATVVDYAGNSISRTNEMNRPRWYSTSITLLDGRTYIQGGVGGEDRPEIRDSSGAFHLLEGANTSSLLFAFPRNFIAPDGRVFGFDGNGFMYYVNTSGAGSLTNVGQFANPKGRDSTAAMFQPGKILIFGGNSNGARVIDITSGAPVLTATQTLSSQRHWTTATVLADGKVLAIGGSNVKNELTGVNYSAEIWNPSTGQWTRGADGSLPRLYHHTALLLPDATVLVSGGGSPGPLYNDNAEIYYPPYLYDANGWVGATSGHRFGAQPRRYWPNLQRAAHSSAEHSARRHGQDRSRHPRLQYGAALHRVDVHAEHKSADGPGAVARSRCAARLLPAVRDQSGRHAIDRSNRHGGRRRRTQPERGTGPRQSRQPVRTDRRGPDAPARCYRSEQ